MNKINSLANVLFYKMTMFSYIQVSFVPYFIKIIRLYYVLSFNFCIKLYLNFPCYVKTFLFTYWLQLHFITAVTRARATHMDIQYNIVCVCSCKGKTHYVHEGIGVHSLCRIKLCEFNYIISTVILPHPLGKL